MNKNGKPDRVAETMAAVADRICSRVLDGSADPAEWLQPWAAAACTGPTNPTTGREYSGVNWWHLLGCALVDGYDAHQWAGYRQWEAAGAQVRKGERATYAVRYTVRPCCDDSECRGACGNRRRVTARGLAVFAREQCDIADAAKFAEKVGEPPPPLEASFDADAITAQLARSGARVKFGGERAAYSPDLDCIVMPHPATFEDAGAYSSTLAHEHCHWTGHSSRLARDMTGSMGSAAYAREELVAELGATMYLAATGLEHRADAQHAAYIASWLRKIGPAERPKAVAQAIGRATKAADYLRERTNAETA